MSTPEPQERPRPESLVSGAPVLPLPSGLFPPRVPLEGVAVRLEPLHPAVHAAELYAASHQDARARSVWTYLWPAPFADEAAFTAWLRDGAAAADPIFYAIRARASGRASGMAAYLRIAPKDGVLEIGHIWFAPAVQRTRLSTEALALMLGHGFDDLGYRRVEWKCDALNAASRRAALRLGFRFEGIFFRHMIVKGRNRDTAWFSMLAEEWPERRAAFAAWLADDNFDAGGRQRRPLTRPPA
ncbi:MAG TPA: GNAT family protein [Rhodospirillales bacterium]|nr:GNAT family protein [Rhodospirillales bacterium]